MSLCMCVWQILWGHAASRLAAGCKSAGKGDNQKNGEGELSLLLFCEEGENPLL